MSAAMSGAASSNPVSSTGESTNHRFLGGRAASAVCHEPAPLYARAAANDADNRPVGRNAGMLLTNPVASSLITRSDRFLEDPIDACEDQLGGATRSALRSSG